MVRDRYWRPDEQMARLRPFFPKSDSKPRVDDRHVLSGIIFINNNGLRWLEPPREYGTAKIRYHVEPAGEKGALAAADRSPERRHEYQAARRDRR